MNVCVRCSYELGIEKPRYVASLFIDRQRVRTRTGGHATAHGARAYVTSGVDFPAEDARS